MFKILLLCVICIFFKIYFVMIELEFILFKFEYCIFILICFKRILICYFVNYVNLIGSSYL